MLVLSRYKNEQVIVGSGLDQVVVTLVDIRGDQVRLGFEAAPHVKIHRKEVHEAIQRGTPPKEQARPE